MLEVIEGGTLYLAIATMLEADARVEAHQAIHTLEANRSHILLVGGAWLLSAECIVFQGLVGHHETLTDQGYTCIAIALALALVNDHLPQAAQPQGAEES